MEVTKGGGVVRGGFSGVCGCLGIGGFACVAIRIWIVVKGLFYALVEVNVYVHVGEKGDSVSSCNLDLCK